VEPSTLYDELVAAGCQVDNHESDLYVFGSKKAVDIIKAHQATHDGFPRSVSNFFSEKPPGGWWIEVPFAYAPWWRARAPKASES